MRTPRGLATLDPVDVGDHVCWLVGSGDDLRAGAGAFVSDGALFEDKVIVFGPAAHSWAMSGPGAAGIGVEVRPDLGADIDATGKALLGAVRQEADAAGRQGFRALRVLAQMELLWPHGASPAQVAGHEAALDALVAELGAIVVCAYPRHRFDSATLRQAAGLHPQHLGGPADVSFRLYSQGPDRWAVTGVVDSEGADTFGMALRELLAATTTVRIRCEGLELMDAAGMVELAQAASAYPDRTIVVSGANATVRRGWRLLGFDDPGIPVEMAP